MKVPLLDLKPQYQALKPALDAALLILVKAVAQSQPRTAAALAREGIVDRAFPEYVRRSCECRIVGAHEHAALAAALRDGLAPGTRVISGAA